MPDCLRAAGVQIVVHDDVFDQTECDPWIFYQAGKNGWIVLTSDRQFMKLFPHMAAVQLGRTVVLAFTSNRNCTMRDRAEAFLNALPKIERALHARRPTLGLIGTIGMNGSFHVESDKPLPSRKLCSVSDRDSYVRACRSEGVEPATGDQ